MILPPFDTLIAPAQWTGLFDRLKVSLPEPVQPRVILGVTLRVSAALPPDIIAFEHKGEIVGLMRLEAEKP